LVNEITLYYDARSKKHQINKLIVAGNTDNVDDDSDDGELIMHIPM